MYFLLILLLLAISKSIHAAPCVVFDSDFNLLVFGLNGKDYNAGSQDTWSGSKYGFFFETSGH
jgi:hypothetical protein